MTRPRWPGPEHGSVFRRLETDAEFKARIRRNGISSTLTNDATGVKLDEYAASWGLYRRIVEDECSAG